MQTSQSGTAGGSPIDDKLQEHIGSQLKRLYDDALQEPVPDRFIELLDKLDNIPTPGEKKQTDGKGAPEK